MQIVLSENLAIAKMGRYLGTNVVFEIHVLFSSRISLVNGRKAQAALIRVMEN